MADLLASKLFLLGVLIGLVTIGVVLSLFVDRYRHVAGRAGDLAVGGRAARHVELLSRTLLVRAEPGAVAAVITPAVDPHRFVAAEPRDGDVAAWVTTLPPAAGRTRVVVRAAATPGWTEFGVVEYPWWSRFPQGARPYRRFAAAAADALAVAGMQVVERRRRFDDGPLAATSDGPRRALDLDPPGPAG